MYSPVICLASNIQAKDEDLVEIMFLFNGIDTIFQPIKEMCEILSNHGINSQTQLPAWMVYSYQAQQLSSDGRFDNLDGLFDISSPENPTACRLFFSIV